MKSILLIILSFIIFIGCEPDNSRKIKLAGGDTSDSQNQNTTATVIQVDQGPLHSIGVIYFNNQTDREEWSWLDRGLADMLVTELSQTPYFNVVSSNELYQVAHELGHSDQDLDDALTSSLVAKNVQADILLRGSYSETEGQLNISIEIFDVLTAQVVGKETVTGDGLDNVLGMIDDLSLKVARNIHKDFEIDPEEHLQLSQMTKSVEAFQSYSKALMFHEKFMWSDAEDCLLDAIRIDTTFAAAYIQLAQIYLSNGKRKNAEMAYNRAKIYQKKLSEPDKIELKMLESYLDGNEYDIIALLEDAVSRFPNNNDLRLKLARYYRNSRNLEKALEHFEIALEKAPSSKLIYNDLGYLFAERGDFSSAIQYFVKYQKMAPDEPNPYDSQGEILMRAGYFNEAIAQYKTALEKWPHFVSSSAALCNIYTELGDYRNTMKYLNIVASDTIDSKIKHFLDYTRPKILWRFGKIAEVEKEIEKIKTDDNEDQLKRIRALEFYRDIGKPEKAGALLQEILKIYEKKILNSEYNSSEIHTYVSILLIENVPAPRALHFMELVDKEKLSGEVKNIFDFVQTVILMRAGETDKAMALFQQARHNMFSLLTRDFNIGRGMAWKYLCELLEAQDRNGNPDFTLLDHFITLADQSNIEYLKTMAQLVKARNYRKAGFPDICNEIYTDLGAPKETDWIIYGAYPIGNFSGFEHVYPPENFNSNEILQGQKSTDMDFDGYVDLRTILGETNWVTAYAELTVISPEEQKVQIRLGTDEACKLWLNEELIWKHFIRKDALLDRDILTVRLKPGDNKILLKVTNYETDWGFYFRITDEFGKGIGNLSFSQPRLASAK